ncbi:MAG: DsbA family protein [Actinomycetota bacterium]|nr:DsbA family protein [Actinomycetota bacterium]
MVVAVQVVYFDYTCPYSRRFSELLDGVGATGARWRPFALAEQNRDDEGPPVWERPDALTRPALLALALHESVAPSGDGDRFRREVFAAFGERRVTPDELRAMAQSAGGQIDEPSLREGLARVAAAHQAARAAGVFGTPTVGTAEEQLGYVKLTGVPAEPGARERLLQTALTVISDIPELAEIKRPTA